MKHLFLFPASQGTQSAQLLFRGPDEATKKEKAISLSDEKDLQQLEQERSELKMEIKEQKGKEKKGTRKDIHVHNKAIRIEKRTDEENGKEESGSADATPDKAEDLIEDQLKAEAAAKEMAHRADVARQNEKAGNIAKEIVEKKSTLVDETFTFAKGDYLGTLVMGLDRAATEKFQTENDIKGELTAEQHKEKDVNFSWGRTKVRIFDAEGKSTEVGLAESKDHVKIGDVITFENSGDNTVVLVNAPKSVVDVDDDVIGQAGQQGGGASGTKPKVAPMITVEDEDIEDSVLTDEDLGIEADEKIDIDQIEAITTAEAVDAKSTAQEAVDDLVEYIGTLDLTDPTDVDLAKATLEATKPIVAKADSLNPTHKIDQTQITEIEAKIAAVDTSGIVAVDTSGITAVDTSTLTTALDTAGITAVDTSAITTALDTSGITVIDTANIDLDTAGITAVDTSAITTALDTAGIANVDSADITTALDTAGLVAVDTTQLTPLVPALDSTVVSPVDTSGITAVDTSTLTTALDTAGITAVDTAGITTALDTAGITVVDTASIDLDTTGITAVDTSTLTTALDTAGITAVDTAGITTALDTAGLVAVDTSSIVPLVPAVDTASMAVDTSTLTTALDTAGVTNIDTGALVTALDTAGLTVLDTANLDTAGITAVDTAGLTTALDTAGLVNIDTAGLTTALDTAGLVVVDTTQTMTKKDTVVGIDSLGKQPDGTEIVGRNQLDSINIIGDASLVKQKIEVKKTYTKAELAEIQKDLLDFMKNDDWGNKTFDFNGLNITNPLARVPLNMEQLSRVKFVEYVTKKCVEKGVRPVNKRELISLYHFVKEEAGSNNINYGVNNTPAENKIIEDRVDKWIDEKNGVYSIEKEQAQKTETPLSEKTSKKIEEKKKRNRFLDFLKDPVGEISLGLAKRKAEKQGVSTEEDTEVQEQEEEEVKEKTEVATEDSVIKKTRNLSEKYGIKGIGTFTNRKYDYEKLNTYIPNIDQALKSLTEKRPDAIEALKKISIIASPQGLREDRIRMKGQEGIQKGVFNEPTNTRDDIIIFDYNESPNEIADDIIKYLVKMDKIPKKYPSEEETEEKKGTKNEKLSAAQERKAVRKEVYEMGMEHEFEIRVPMEFNAKELKQSISSIAGALRILRFENSDAVNIIEEKGIHLAALSTEQLSAAGKSYSLGQKEIRFDYAKNAGDIRNDILESIEQF